MVVVNDVEVKLEDVAMVTCLSSSPYTTAMLWRYHGEVLSNSSKYVITNGNNMSILQVMNVERNDFGSYRCDVIDSVHKTTFAIGYLNHTSKYVTGILCMCHQYPLCVTRVALLHTQD